MALEFGHKGQGTALPPHKAGKEVRKGEVFYSWGQGGKTLSLYGFSSDQRQVGRSGKEQGSEGEAVAGPGQAESPEPGAEGLAGERAGRMRPASPSLSLTHSQRAEAGGRQMDSAKPSSFRLWWEVGGSSWKSRGLGLPWPRAAAAGTGPSGPLGHCSMAPLKGPHSLHLFLLSLIPHGGRRTSSSG